MSTNIKRPIQNPHSLATEAERRAVEAERVSYIGSELNICLHLSSFSVNAPRLKREYEQMRQHNKPPHCVKPLMRTPSDGLPLRSCFSVVHVQTRTRRKSPLRSQATRLPRVSPICSRSTASCLTQSSSFTLAKVMPILPVMQTLYPSALPQTVWARLTSLIPFATMCA
jgi:hypothetical protein